VSCNEGKVLPRYQDQDVCVCVCVCVCILITEEGRPVNINYICEFHLATV
jgi:hypothetical protein